MIFLKFPDEQTFLEKAEESGLMHEHRETGELEVTLNCHEYSIDIIGTIYTEGEYTRDEETGELVEVVAPVALEGYHINMIGMVPENFQEYIISRPNTPNRVFAGY